MSVSTINSGTSSVAVLREQRRQNLQLTVNAAETSDLANAQKGLAAADATLQGGSLAAFVQPIGQRKTGLSALTGTITQTLTGDPSANKSDPSQPNFAHDLTSLLQAMQPADAATTAVATTSASDATDASATDQAGKIADHHQHHHIAGSTSTGQATSPAVVAADGTAVGSGNLLAAVLASYANN